VIATHGRILAATLCSLAAIFIARQALPVGLRGQHFANAQLGGPPAYLSRDAELSTLQLLRRWRFDPPPAFSAQWSGYLYVSRAGVHTFTINADDGARLFVDGRAVIEDTGQGPGPRSERIELSSGPHQVRLQYVQLGGSYHLEWTWSVDDNPPVPVPASVLSPNARGRIGVLAVRVIDGVWWVLLGASAALALTFVYRPSYWSRCGGAGAPADPATSSPVSPGTLNAVSSLALFVAFAVAHTWPLATDPGHLSRNDNADTMLNEWAIAWVAHQLPRDPLRLFEANIFHPSPHALAYSEPLIVQGMMGAPLFWLGASPVLAYNIVLLAGLALTGWSTAWVVSRWTADPVAGIAAGIAVAFNAHTLTRLPHLQAQHAEFLPLALLALDALLLRPRWSTSVVLAVWSVLQGLASIHLLVFTALVLVVSFAVRPEDWLGRERFRAVAPKLALAAVGATAVLFLILGPYRQLHAMGFERSLEEVAHFAARPSDYLVTPSRVHAWLGTAEHVGTGLFPGIAVLALAGAALFWYGRPPLERRLRMCVAFGIVGVVLSFGPLVPGYASLHGALAPVRAIRASARFGYLGLVAAGVAAGYGLAALRRAPAGRRWWKPAISTAALAALFLEPFAAPIEYYPFTAIPEIYRRIAEEPGAVAADLPFPPTGAIFRNAPYMLGSTLNFKPLLNGYSGFVPPVYSAHYAKLAGFPDAASIAALRLIGVTHVFVHRDRLDDRNARAIEATPGLRWLATEGPIDLYRVERDGG
jgi:hypothetical protein